MSGEKKVVIIAGPNGSGKTTFALEFLPNEADCPNFINADLLASGLNPFAPEKAAIRAGKLMLDLMEGYIRRKESFSFETTLSGKGFAGKIVKWQSQSYRVKLFFLGLPSAEYAIHRIKQRVLEGGHFVPDEVVRRRFKVGLENLENLYKPIVDEWVVYDNSGLTPVLHEKGGKNE